MDKDGTPLHITQYEISMENTFMDGNIDTIIEFIKGKFADLINLEHEHIINFKNIAFSKDEITLRILVAREAINGVTIETFSKMSNWSIRSIRQVANALLQVVYYLQNQNIACGNISSSSVYLDDSGEWKVADFYITPFLNYFKRHRTIEYSWPNMKTDLTDIANLIESFGSASSQVISFIYECRKDYQFYDFETLSRLKEHQLLQSMHRSFDDFEVLGCLGKGSFGEVFKVKDSMLIKSMH